MAALLGVAAAGGDAAGAEADGLALREPRGADGGTLFYAHPLAELGMADFVNAYSSPEVWRSRWREYLIGPIGVGVATGDVDQDGLPDVFLVSKDESSRLYRNLGDFRFADVTAEAGLQDRHDPASGAAFADVDNDGDLDLYACYVDAPNQLWINDGSGRFTEEAVSWGLALQSGATVGAFADYDRDGDLDLYLLNNVLQSPRRLSEKADRLLQNRGDHFVDVSATAGIEGAYNGHGVVWTDVDGDLWPDIYIGNDFEGPDLLYRNNGDGTFTDILPAAIPETPYYSMGVDSGDLNNDGRIDLWASDMAPVEREHRLRTMGNHIHVFEATRGLFPPQFIKNALLLNLGEGRFADLAFLAGMARTDWTWAPRLADLDNDGWLDGFVTNGMLRSFHDADLGEKERRIGHRDAMAIVFRSAPVRKEPNLAYRNLGDLRFEEVGAAWGLDHPGVSFGASFADLDRDGDLDLVVNNFGEGPLVLENRETSGRRLVVRLEGRESNRYGIGARVTARVGERTQVRELTLVRGYMSSDEPILHFGLGSAEKVDRLEIRWPSGVVQTLENLPAGHAFRIREQGPTSPAAPPPAGSAPPFVRKAVELPVAAERRESPFDDFAAQPLLPFPRSRPGPPVAIADLDRDGRNDLVLGGATGLPPIVLRHDDAGHFEEVYTLDFEMDFGAEDTDLALADVDRDGDQDLLIASGGVELPPDDDFYRDRLYRNDGRAGFSRDPSMEWPFPAHPTAVLVTADVDEDGLDEVFTGSGTRPGRYPFAASSTLWSGAQMEALQRFDGRISDAAMADVDGDGDLDLVLAREWDRPALLLQEDGRFEDRTDQLLPPNLEGLWSAVAIADLDGDGRTDIVLGNLGQNTEYAATAAEPIRLWHSSDPESDVRLLETSVQGGGEWTREVKGRLEPRFPEFLGPVSSYRQFATTPFPELFPGLPEQGFEVLEARELRSGVLWQQPDGGFVFAPLPPLAQAGRLHDLVVLEFEGDADPDLVAVLAPHAPEPWAGRFLDGFLVAMRNQGERTFEAMLPADSGLTVTGAPRRLATGDLDQDGRPEVVVTRSEGLPLVFSLSLPPDSL